MVPITVHLLEATPALFTMMARAFPLRDDVLTLNQVTTFPWFTVLLGAAAGYIGWAAGSMLRFQAAPASLVEQSPSIFPTAPAAPMPPAVSGGRECA